jgi:hypothetical protein
VPIGGGAGDGGGRGGRPATGPPAESGAAVSGAQTGACVLRMAGAQPTGTSLASTDAADSRAGRGLPLSGEGGGAAFPGVSAGYGDGERDDASDEGGAADDREAAEDENDRYSDDSPVPIGPEPVPANTLAAAEEGGARDEAAGGGAPGSASSPSAEAITSAAAERAPECALEREGRSTVSDAAAEEPLSSSFVLLSAAPPGTSTERDGSSGEADATDTAADGGDARARTRSFS